MGLSLEVFLYRLREGKAVNCVYNSGDLEGLISAWSHLGSFVVTWEECRSGDQYNEQAYTRDERFEFGTPEEVAAFVEQAGHPTSHFEP